MGVRIRQNGPWLVHAAKFLFITHFFPLREVLFSLGAPLFFSRLIRTIKSVERRKNEKNQLENYLFCHFTAFCPETGIGHAYHGGLFTHRMGYILVGRDASIFNLGLPVH
jgi:hypothetical protein